MTDTSTDIGENEEVPRQFQRSLITKSVKVRVDNEYTNTTIRDVALGGVKLDWPTAKSVDDQLIVYFSTDLYFDGIVRWCKPVENHFELGTQFPDLDEIAAIYLGEYIEQLLEDNTKLLTDDEYH